MIDIVQTFENYATAAGYEFTYGRMSNTEWIMTDDIDLDSGESVVVLFPIIEDGEIANSFPQSWSVSTQIWLGRKFDEDNASGTSSELDESDRQKWDRRLFALRTAIETYIKTVFCSEPGLELTRARISTFLNQTDENLDFIGMEVAFKYDSRV